MLDHRQPVCCLYAGAFQPIVEDRIFVRRHIESGGLAHHLDADVVRVAIREQVVEVIHRTRKHPRQHSQNHLSDHQPPEMLRQRLVLQYHATHAVDDETADDADAHWQKRNQNADGNIPEDDGRTGLPDEMKHGRNIFKRSQTISPRATLALRALFVYLAV